MNTGTISTLSGNLLLCFAPSFTYICYFLCLFFDFLCGSGRYAQFAIQLNSQGYGVFGMDWIGKEIPSCPGLFPFVSATESLLRGNYIAEYCNDVWTVCAGHGGSDGLHGYVQALDHVVSDVVCYIRRVHSLFSCSSLEGSVGADSLAVVGVVGLSFACEV